MAFLKRETITFGRISAAIQNGVLGAMSAGLVLFVIRALSGHLKPDDVDLIWAIEFGSMAVGFFVNGLLLAGKKRSVAAMVAFLGCTCWVTLSVLNIITAIS